MSIIIKMFCTFILQITLLLSVLFLLRGHNYPGGGFIGALIACTGLGFYTLAYQRPPHCIQNKETALLSIGIICLVMSILMPLVDNKNMLTALWYQLTLFNQVIKLGTPLLFDIGIYLSILGGLSLILTYLENENI